MKKSIPLVLLIGLFLIICLVPASEATVLDDNPESGAVPTVNEDDSMVNNRGLIINNYGEITNNYGIILNNYGTVTNNWANATIEKNNGTVGENRNNGTIIDNYGEITTNNGKVMRCLGASEIGTNGANGLINEINGSSEVTANNGTIVRMFGGEVTTNAYGGRISYVTCNSSNDPGVIGTNSGTIVTILKGTVGINNGTITRLANDSAITSGTAATYDYTGLSSLWVGNTYVTPSVTSGDGWEFNFSNNTLRLENANITGKIARTGGFMNEDFDGVEESSAVIYNATGKTLNISVVGENTITTSSADFAIYSEGGINIAGTGSLTINNTDSQGCGIYAAGGMRVTSGTITSNSVFEAIKLRYGNLQIDGGTVSATTSYMGTDEVNILGNISVTEGSLSAESIYIYGDLSVTGGTLNAKLLYAYTDGFTPGEVNIEGGTVNIGSSGNLGCDQFSMSGGTVNIGSSGYISVMPGGFLMTGGTISIQNGGYIYAANDITINGGIIDFKGDLPDSIPGLSSNDCFVMTGGRVTVSSAHPTAGRILIQSTSLDYGEATLTNLTPETTTLSITASAPASLSFPLPKYTVTFDADGGTGEMDAAVDVNEYELPENGFTPPDGMVFKCWSVNDVEMDPGDVIIIWDDTIVYAVWEAQEWMGYTVSYNAGGGSGHMDTMYASGGFEVPDCQFIPPDGKVFWRWTSSGGQYFRPHDHTSITSNEMFTAHWTLPGTYGVMFDNNGGSGFMQPVTGLNGDQYTLPACTFYAPGPDRAFKCWQIGDRYYNPGDTIIVYADTVAKAIWDSKYTVTFDANGGSCDTPSAFTDGNGRLAALPDATYTDHWLIGWYTAATGGTAITTNTVFTENTTVYAHWGPVTVTFDANGGTCATPSAQTNAQNKLASLPDATREHYRFDGWFTAASGGSAVTTDTAFTENTTIYAHWTQLYTVTYKANGGTGDDVIVPDILGEYTLAANGFTAPADKVFKCWLIGENEMYPNAKITVSADVTVKAVWKDAPAPEPTPTHDGDNYSNTITAGTDTNVTTTFTEAKASNGTVNVKVGDMDIKFDKDAVSAIGGNTVSLKAEVKTGNNGVEGAEAVVEVTLDGATFSNGKATLTVPFTQEVPSGKLVKVYFINGTQKTEMTDATYQDGKVVFTTNHFSTYAIMFEDDPDASGGNGGGFPVWIIGVIVAVVAVAGVAVFIFMKKH